MTPQEARALISTTETLECDGIPASRVHTMVATGELIAVHRGRYVHRSEWDAAFSESRHLLAVVAADSYRRSDDAVFTFASAAAAHGLPLFRHRAGAPHISSPHADGVVGGSVSLRRHEIAVPVADRVVVGGIAVTSLQRTVYDIIRTTSRETAISCADAALRIVAWDQRTRRYDDAAAGAWREAMRERIARNPGARGIRQARWVIEFADGRAQLPGESTSRLYITDLGFAEPRVQVPFPGPNGEDYAIDFGLDDVQA